MDRANSSSEESISSGRKIEEHKKYAKKLKSEQSQFFKRTVNEEGKLHYLLQQAEMYANFLFSGETKQEEQTPCKERSARKRIKRNKDEEEFLDEMRSYSEMSRISVQPSILRGGQLRDYQISGVN